LRCFPNFNADHHRSFYPEIEPGKAKRIFEMVLRLGPVQLLEGFSRLVLTRHLREKSTERSDIQLDTRRLKLPTHSHKRAILQLIDYTPLRVRSLQPQSKVINNT